MQFHSGTGKGIKGLEHVVLQVGGPFVEVTQIVAVGDVGALQQGHGMLANAEEPVRMTDPLHIGFFTEVEFAFEVGALEQFVKDDAIVDALHGNTLSRFVEVV